MKIAVLASTDDWHYQDLRRAAGSSKVELVAIDYRTFQALLSSQSSQLGVTDRTGNACQADLTDFDCLLVRAMPAGTLQQVVFRMDVLGQLQRQGQLIVNSPRTIEAAVDKYLTLELIRQAGVPVPVTAVCESYESALSLFALMGEDVVLKPLFGSQGRGILRIGSQRQMEQVLAERIKAGEIVYMQQFIEHGNRDLRLFVIGDDVIAMRRSNPDDWITNSARGSLCEPVQPSPEQIQIALAASRAVGGEITGVDIVTNQDGHDFVLEVNACPGWKSLSRATGVDTASQVIHHLTRIHRGISDTPIAGARLNRSIPR